MYAWLGVFAGGGAGSVLRWWISGKIIAPWGTMLVNVLGAFCIGAAYVYFQRLDINPYVKTAVMAGLLGGFTTFSTYLLDFVRLAGQGRAAEAWLYLLGSLAAGCGALLLGIKLGNFFRLF